MALEGAELRFKFSPTAEPDGCSVLRIALQRAYVPSSKKDRKMLAEKLKKLEAEVARTREIPTACLKQHFEECGAGLSADIRAHRDYARHGMTATKVSKESAAAADASMADKLGECQAKLVSNQQLVVDLEAALLYYLSGIEKTEPDPDCKGVSAMSGSSTIAAHRAYFDGILRPRLHDHYHYRHDDNIASVAGGYSSDYQPLISGEYNDIKAIGSGSSMLIGVVGVSSVVIIIMLLFCVCLAFVMGIYYGYSQKSALQRKRAKEERCWIDENRNET